MPNLLQSKPAGPLVAASILSADFANMGADCRAVLGLDPGTDGSTDADRSGFADLLHLDVMDGHFVPNLTMGPDLCKAVRRSCPDATLDVHLMVSYPEQFFVPFAEAGADHLTFHYESAPEDDDRARQIATDRAAQVRELGLTAGLAINPMTPAEQILPIADAFDLILIMSVQPGFSGQAFRPEVLQKGWLLRREMPERVHLEIDGGVSPDNADRVRESGFDVLVSASAIFGKSSWNGRYDAIRAIRGAGVTAPQDARGTPE